LIIVAETKVGKPPPTRMRIQTYSYCNDERLRINSENKPD